LRSAPSATYAKFESSPTHVRKESWFLNEIRRFPTVFSWFLT
jgi:hypothetical protein